MRRFLSILILTLFLFGCAGQDFLEKQSEVASEGAYGIPAAIDNGRIDKADSIAQSYKVLYPYPVHPIISDPIIDPKTGLTDVILPARLSGKVVVVGSADYIDLEKTKSIANQLTLDNKGLLAYKAAAEDQKKKDDQVLNSVLKELNDYKKSIFFWAYLKWTAFKWILGSGIFLGIIAFIAIIIFAPEAIPFVLTILGKIAGVIYNVVASIFSYLINLIKKKVDNS